MKKIIAACITLFSLLIITPCFSESIKSDNSFQNSEALAIKTNDANKELLISVSIGLLSGIVSGLISSGMFWYFFYAKQPIFQISDEIAKVHLNGKDIYVIKVINKTNAKLKDVKFKFQLATVEVVEPKKPSRISLDNIKIGLKEEQTQIMIVNEYIEKKKRANGDDADYALQFRIGVDLESLCQSTLPKQSYLLFTIYGTHSISGFGAAAEKTYGTYSNPINKCIVAGEFENGDSMKIIKTS